ncbi:MAG: endolytic transglycosylase MltG [Bacteroidota bacterium]
MAGATNKRSRGGLWIILILLGVAAFAAYKVLGPNTGSRSKGDYLYVRTGSDYEKLKQNLTEGGFISDMWSFDLIAKQLGLPAHVRAGKYKITAGMSNYRIIRMLRAGRQEPVKLVIRKLRIKNDLVTYLAKNLEADSLKLRQMLQDPSYLSEFGLDTNTAMCAIMPDTYEFYWNTSADKAFRKIQKNYARFWDDTRKQAAAARGLTPPQAIIIASIVEEETNAPSDKPLIASVYLNRTRIGMRLQADPTVKFAVGDFTIRRIAGAMLDNPSPYNTYKYAGLPPGPICTPTAATINAVLQSPKTTYMYFCAKADFSGRHDFATTYDEQLKNARAYQQALNARGIH